MRLGQQVTKTSVGMIGACVKHKNYSQMYYLPIYTAITMTSFTCFFNSIVLMLHIPDWAAPDNALLSPLVPFPNNTGCNIVRRQGREAGNISFFHRHTHTSIADMKTLYTEHVVHLHRGACMRPPDCRRLGTRLCTAASQPHPRPGLVLGVAGN